MVSLPLLGFLWSVLRHVAKRAEDRFKPWTKPATFTLLEGVAENAFLLKQLIVVERQMKHPAFTSFDRGLFVM